MSDSLAPAEPTVRSFETSVESVDGTEVTLAETYFYPEGGGQPPDRGTVAGVPVVDVQSRDDAVVHTLAEEPALSVGDAVAGVVDDDFRTYCMRAHTASHVLYGAGRRLLDDLGYGGFGIRAASPERRNPDAGITDGDGGDVAAPSADEEKVRVDFVTSTEITDEVLVELERLVNRAVWDARAVTWEERPVEAAREDGAVAFNTKTEEGVMADADTVRVVEIEGWDAAACGGTHVANTSEIGPVTVLGRSNPGEGLTRVEFAVGPAGIRRRADTHGAALDAARTLGVALEDLPEAVERVDDEREEALAEATALREEALVRRVRGFDRVDRDGVGWRVGSVSGVDANAVGEAAQTVVRGESAGSESGDAAVADAPHAVAAVGDGESPFVVVAVDPAVDAVDAGDVVDRVTDEFGGGGGGSPAFAQGGGLDAEPDAVVSFLRSP
ncbi:alanine--tRNA ligase-related protein [Halobaculum sp. CBA1158]|uniref:alanyl-tRNA editing protein n=1 Tax=Halobaculum sp. CBA1158 TaxID=2904243 RepID=UPI001F42E943|nr:alanine--tRNA ligase-related protein [Halobaculum sp. CBA1158]UIO98592.1 alanine--tRNA ligase-related protein [Halobaculum sp. CBA1158]